MYKKCLEIEEPAPVCRYFRNGRIAAVFALIALAVMLVAAWRGV
jgi:hypothetical protein